MYSLGSIASRVVWNADKVLCPIGQVIGFLGTPSWRPATVGLLWFHLHSELAAASSSLVAPSSAAVLIKRGVMLVDFKSKREVILVNLSICYLLGT